MNYFTEEPKYQHGDAPKIGIILANLGTPDSLSTHAVRKYLQQFLNGSKSSRDTTIHLVLDSSFHHSRI